MVVSVDIADPRSVKALAILAVQVLRLRDAVRALSPADRAWAAEALADVLADCHVSPMGDTSNGEGSPR